MIPPDFPPTTRTPEECAENYRQLRAVAPTPKERFALMFNPFLEASKDHRPMETWEAEATNEFFESHFEPMNEDPGLANFEDSELTKSAMKALLETCPACGATVAKGWRKCGMCAYGKFDMTETPNPYTEIGESLGSLGWAGTQDAQWDNLKDWVAENIMPLQAESRRLREALEKFIAKVGFVNCYGDTEAFKGEELKVLMVDVSDFELLRESLRGEGGEG